MLKGEQIVSDAFASLFYQFIDQSLPWSSCRDLLGRLSLSLMNSHSGELPWIVWMARLSFYWIPSPYSRIHLVDWCANWCDQYEIIWKNSYYQPSFSTKISMVYFFSLLCKSSLDQTSLSLFSLSLIWPSCTIKLRPRNFSEITSHSLRLSEIPRDFPTGFHRISLHLAAASLDAA